MSKYFHLTVREVVEETSQAKTIVFWQPIHQQVIYKAGQFLTLIIEIEGKKHRRSYSMSSSPREGSLAITVKKVYNGLVSNYIFENIKPGDAIEVMEPMGSFIVEPNAANKNEYVFIAGGSGITPLIAMAKTILPVENHSKISLIYASRSENDIIFKLTLDELEQKYPANFKVLHALSQPSNTWVGYNSRINQANLITILEQNFGINIKNAQYYLCGPVGIMDEAKKVFELFEVPASQINQELFTSTSMLETEDQVIETGSKARTITVNYEGQTHLLEVKAHETILEAALSIDLDLPYSCQAGMCTACLAKCTSGSIKMDEEDGLTENEIKQGYILTCVARPTSGGVIIDIE